MQVFIIAALTVDGFIAEKTDQSSLDWTSQEDKKFFVERTKEAGAIVVGRKTFETFPKALPNRLNLVLTAQSGLSSEDSNVEYVNLSAQGVVELAQERGYKELAVCGGASVYGQFLLAGVVDKLYLTIEPVVFGGGVKLFDKPMATRLKLDGVSKLSSQTLLLTYSVKK